MAVTADQTTLTLLSGMRSGAVVDLQITTPTAPKRAKTTFVGMDAPHGLIFSIPASPKWASTRDLLLPGNSLVVRHVLEGELGTVIAFRVSVLRMLHSPLSILLTSFPHQVEFQGLREEKRGQPGIAVHVSHGGQDNIEAIIIDVSRKGCRLAISQARAFTKESGNNKLTLTCHMDGKDITIATAIKNHTTGHAYSYYGLAFEGPAEQVEALLERHSLFYD